MILVPISFFTLTGGNFRLASLERERKSLCKLSTNFLADALFEAIFDKTNCFYANFIVVIIVCCCFFDKNKCFYANFIVKQKLPVVGISLALRGAYNQKQLNTRYTLVNKRKPYL